MAAGHLPPARVLGAAFRHRDSRHGNGARCPDPRTSLAFRVSCFATPRRNCRPSLILLFAMKAAPSRILLVGSMLAAACSVGADATYSPDKGYGPAPSAAGQVPPAHGGYRA